MRHFTQGRIQRQVSFLRQQFLQDGDLPFTDVLTAEVVSQALAAIRHMLERQNLHAARDALGLPRTSAQRRPLLPCRGGPADRTSRFAGS